MGPSKIPQGPFLTNVNTANTPVPFLYTLLGSIYYFPASYAQSVMPNKLIFLCRRIPIKNLLDDEIFLLMILLVVHWKGGY